MTELLHDLDAPSDAELISRVRAGDAAAYGELFERHVDAARRLARQLVRGPDSDDLVSDAFTKVMQVLQGGGGPDVAFRAYLLTAIRRLHVDRMRSQARLTTSDDMTQFDPGVPFNDTAVANFENGAAAKAFASLPERWQLVLWHLEVEGQKPADIAPLLGMTPNSVSALAYRAREGLRQAFLTAHLADTPDAGCRWVTEHLGAYVREGLSKRDTAKVKDHLDQCRPCTAMYLELTEVNSNLAAIIGPLLLGAAAAGYAASAGAGASGLGGLSFLIGRARDVVLANTTTAVATGAVAATVVTGVSVGAVVAIQQITGDDSPSSAARQPVAAAPAEPGGDSASGDPTQAEQAPIGQAQADIALTGAQIADDSVVLGLAGLPDVPVSINIDLTSQTGLTTFKVNNGTCTVSAQLPTRAVCDPTMGAGGAALLALTPSTFEAVVPLAWDSGLQEDTLSVRVSVPGFVDPVGGDTFASFRFVPSQPAEGDTTDTGDDTIQADGPIAPVTVSPTPTAAPSTAPTSGPTPTQPATPTPTQPAQPTPTTPVPTDPVPTDPVPTDPVPTDPVPTDPVPTDPVPTDPVPTDPVPTDPVPTDPVPTDPVPTDPVPTDPVPTDPVPTDPTPVPQLTNTTSGSVALGQPLRLSVGVTPADAGGFVIFFRQVGILPIPVCTASVSGGEAACSPAWTPTIGTHTFIAAYTGDLTNPGGLTQITISVTKAAASLQVADLTIDAGEAAAVPVTVTVANLTATGDVVITEGDTTLGRASLSAGAATIALPATLAPGAHRLTATYAGNSQIDGTSATFTVTVEAEEPPVDETRPTSSYPAWEAGTVYQTGDWVTYDGRTFQVAPGQPYVTEVPGQTWGAWMEYASDPSTELQVWTPSWIFSSGDWMLYDGRTYQANPKTGETWIRGTAPSESNPNATPWQLIETNPADGKPIWTRSRIFTSDTSDPDFAHEAWHNGVLYRPNPGQVWLRDANPETSGRWILVR